MDIQAYLVTARKWTPEMDDQFLGQGLTIYLTPSEIQDATKQFGPAVYGQECSLEAQALMQKSNPGDDVILLEFQNA